MTAYSHFHRRQKQGNRTLLTQVQWLALAITFLLGGCQILPLTPAPPTPLEKRSWPEHLRHLTQLEDWRIRGKIGYIGKNDSGSAYVDWIQSRDSFHITLTGPLGQGTTIISGNAQGARLDSNKDGSFFAESPEQLLLDHTGVSLPVSDMYHWIKGMPSVHNDESITLGADNTLEKLQQGEWTINYADYQPHLDNLLPTRIKIKGREVKITLIVKAWEPLPDDE